MRTNSPYLDLTTELNHPQDSPLNSSVYGASLEGKETILEELEEDVSVVKDEIERLGDRLSVVERRLSNLNSAISEKAVNSRMANFHHVYDPARRTW